jgi:hypothetical protein
MGDVIDKLHEVFGDPTNVTPSGTGAVLVQPSQLSLDLVSQVVKKMPLDQINLELGRLAAGHLADELELQGLKASDYADLPELAQVIAKRITGRLHNSNEFSRGVREGLKARG